MSVSFSDEVREIMDMRFGCDSLIALATVEGDIPSVRAVNAYYEDGCFYVITNALSNKMKQIAVQPTVGLCGEWFTGHGVCENLGHVLCGSNAEMMSKLRTVFDEWYDNGHINESDPNTILLRIRLTDGTLWNNGVRHVISIA